MGMGGGALETLSVIPPPTHTHTPSLAQDCLLGGEGGDWRSSYENSQIKLILMDCLAIANVHGCKMEILTNYHYILLLLLHNLGVFCKGWSWTAPESLSISNPVVCCALVSGDQVTA